MAKPLPRIFRRILLVLFLLLLVPLSAVLWLAFRPLPLQGVAPIVEYMLGNMLEPYRIELTEPVLRYVGGDEAVWVLSFSQLRATAPNGALISVSGAELHGSMAGLRRGLLIAPQIITAQTVIIRTGGQTALPATYSSTEPINLFEDVQQKLLGARNSQRGAFFKKLDIARIAIIADPNVAATQIPKSTIRVVQDADGMRANVVLHYRSNSASGKLLPISGLKARANLPRGAAGHVQIDVTRLRLSDLSSLMPIFGFLRAIDLPVNADVNLAVGDDGKLQTGMANLKVSAGVVSMPGAALRVGASRLKMQVDFAEQRIAILDSILVIARSQLGLRGALTYQIGADGQIGNFLGKLRGDKVLLDLPGVFAPPLQLARFDLDFALVAQNKIYIQTMAFDFGDGRVTLDGEIEQLAEDMWFDMRANFDPMPLAQLRRLWPVSVARGARDWAAERVSGGQVLGGKLVIKSLLSALSPPDGQAIAAEALALTVGFIDVRVDYADGLPPLKNAGGRLELSGNRFIVHVKQAEASVPHPDKPAERLAVRGGYFAINDFAPQHIFADMRLEIDAPIAAAMRVLTDAPLRLLRKVNFDFERLSGDVNGWLALRLPLDQKITNDNVSYRAGGTTRNVALAGEMAGLRLTHLNADLEVTRRGLWLAGHGRANNVPAYTVWEQSFRAGAKQPTRIGVSGQMDNNALAALGQHWVARRMGGTAHVNMLLTGSLPYIDEIRFAVDARMSQITAAPLGYKKPKSVPAQLKLRLGYDRPTDLRRIIFDYRSRADRVSGALQMSDGVISGGRVFPIRLGKDNAATLTISDQPDGKHIRLWGKRLSLAGIFKPSYYPLADPPPSQSGFGVLGQDFTVDMAFDSAPAFNNITFRQPILRARIADNLIEELQASAQLPEAGAVEITVMRQDKASRRLTASVDNMGSLMRAANLMDDMSGGRLVLESQLDDGRKTAAGERLVYAEGRAAIDSFTLRDVPLLAQLLSLGSLTGIADTLSGDGLRFDGGALVFKQLGDRLTIDDGQITGAAVGVTVRGDYDLAYGELDFGGSIAPAYSLSAFLRNIPIIGWILVGGEGEGLVGMSYRVYTEDERLRVIGNPISFFFPGILRRIFNIGIGLPPRAEARE